MKLSTPTWLATLVASAAAFSSELPPGIPPPVGNDMDPAMPVVTPTGTKIQDMAGAVAPLGFWDPLGFSEGADSGTMKRYREAELVHGRVAMSATVGFLSAETLHQGPAIDNFSETPQVFWVLLLFSVSFLELIRAQIGWVEPEDVPYDQAGLLRSSYVPGDLGFDPLGWKPTDPTELKTMQTKELSNGRLAMIGAIGIIAQEAVQHKGIGEQLFG